MSKTATPFRDLVKANDLVTKNFFANNTFAVTTETKSGDYSFKTSLNGDSAGKKPVSATVEPKYEWKEHNLAFEGKLSSANSVSGMPILSQVFDSAGRCQVTISVPATTRLTVSTPKATLKNTVPGLSVHLQGERAYIAAVKGADGKDTKAASAVQSATAGVTYANDKVHLLSEAKVSVPFDKATLSAAFHAKPVDNVSVGLKAEWDTKDVKAEAKLVGGTGQLEGAVSVTYPEKVVGLGFWHSHNAQHQWAAVVNWPTAEGGKPSVTVANSYKFDDNTTVKSKAVATIDRSEAADNVYRAGVSLQQKVNDNVTVSVGTDVNLNNVGLGKSGDASTYGVQVAFK